jgi:hypothetical protein
MRKFEVLLDPITGEVQGASPGSAVVRIDSCRAQTKIMLIVATDHRAELFPMSITKAHYATIITQHAETKEC